MTAHVCSNCAQEKGPHSTCSSLPHICSAIRARLYPQPSISRSQPAVAVGENRFSATVQMRIYRSSPELAQNATYPNCQCRSHLKSNSKHSWDSFYTTHSANICSHVELINNGEFYFVIVVIL